MAETPKKVRGRKGTVRRTKNPASPTRGPSIGPARGPAIPEVKVRSRALPWDPNNPDGHVKTKVVKDSAGLKEKPISIDDMEAEDDEVEGLPPLIPGEKVDNARRPFIPAGIAAVKLSPEHKHIINLMARFGATTREIAHELNLSEAQLRAIAMKDREIIEELKVGREFADARVEEALYRRATGYTYDAEKIFCVLGRIVRAPIIEHVPPDVEACKFWLKARSEQWRAGDGRPSGDGDPVTAVNITVESGRKDASG